MECETPSKTPGAAVHVLGREELVGRVLDYLNCEAICTVCATAKAFDLALGHVESLSIVNVETLPAHVWRRFRAVREVLYIWRPLDEHDTTIARLFEAAVLVGQQWRSLVVRIDRDDFDDTFEDITIQGLRTLRLAVARGALPRLDHFGIDCYMHTIDDTDILPELVALAEVLPPFAAARLAVSLLDYIHEGGHEGCLAARTLGRASDRHPNFDINHRTRRHGPLLLDAIQRPCGRNGEKRAMALTRSLLGRGADPNLSSLRYGTTPSCEAAKTSLDFVKLLVQAGGRLTSDPSPLFYACGGEVGLWRMEFSDGWSWFVDNSCTIGGDTRHYKPKLGLVQYLLDQGVDPLADFGGGRCASDLLQDLLKQAHSGMSGFSFEMGLRMELNDTNEVNKLLSNSRAAQRTIEKLESMVSSVSAAALRATREQLKEALAAAHN